MGKLKQAIQSDVLNNWIVVDTNDTESVKTAEIFLLSELNINQDMETFKESLFNCLNKYRKVIITSKDGFQIDIAFLQLLTAFTKTADEMGVGINLDIKFNNESKELIKKSGFSNLFEIYRNGKNDINS